MEPAIYWAVVYGSRVVVFLLVLHRWHALWTGKILRFLLLTLLLFTAVWMRWIEPQQIALRTTDFSLGIGKKVALIADLHLGVYKDWTYLQRVVNTINNQPDIDMVLIAGDLTFWPDIEQKKLEELFQPLADLRMPIYMVLGNHDVQKPGPKLRTPLVKALQTHGVVYLENDVLDFGSWTLVGLGDHDGGTDKVALLDQFHVSDTVVVLTHNPDTTRKYTNSNADLTLVGHTHCGQIRLPWVHHFLARYIIPVQGNFDCGVTKTKYTTLLITPGLGEVILPLRWFNPPTIDLISF